MNTPAVVVSQAPTEPPSQAPSTAPAADASSEQSPEAEATESESAGGLTKPFGSTFTWDDGAAITVSAPKVFRPTEYAAKEAADEYVVMTVTLTNGTKQPMSAMAFSLNATTGDAEATSVFDSEAGIDLPTAKVLPGKSLKYKVGFGRTKKAEFIVAVSYDFNEEGYYK